MREPIAKVRIAVGNPGWYDSLTNIHLTIARPEAIVYEGQNTTNLKMGVAHKLIYVVEGSLDYVKKAQQVVEPQQSKVEAPHKEVDKKDEEIVREAIEPIKEVEEEEKKKVVKKKTTRSKKKTEDVEASE